MALFDVRELISMAVKDEETGIAFYKGLAKVAKTQDVKDTCMEIAQQEEGHAARFLKMLEEIGHYQPREEYAGQYDEYVRALLNNKAFPEPEKAAEKARSVRSDVEGVLIAMSLERDALLFYQELKTLIKPEYMEYVEEIIDEERGHLIDLARLKNRL